MLSRNTLAQVALFCRFDHSALALRRTFEDMLGVPEVNRRLAADGSGFSVVYPDPLMPPAPGWEHRNGVSGHRLPDMDLVLADGSPKSLYRSLETARWVELHRSPNTEAPPSAEWITSIYLAPEFHPALPADVSSVLVRPDGYLAHVKSTVSP
jgi:hypothetical protein